LAEYRLQDLSRISGVTPRNIRAYRERGLLDPPRREGRSAYYSDLHLSQLETINQLHRRGFNSAHIAEFFAGMRTGRDLADMLGLQRVVPGCAHRPAQTAPGAVALSPAADEARRLVDLGLAEVKDDAVVLSDPAIAGVVERTSDPRPAARALVYIADSARTTVDELAAEVVDGLDDYLSSRLGPDYVPTTAGAGEPGRALQDYRELADAVVGLLIDQALRERMASAVPGAEVSSNH
jgi:DNA-binding transcriptional MerR regulator